MSESIKVICRFRPFNEREKAEEQNQPKQKPGEGSKLEFVGSNGVNVEIKGAKSSFAFDNVFNPECTQLDVFEACKPTFLDVCSGFNGTIFAYGQTGAGKTFTMFGPDDYENHPDMWGLVPRATRTVFEHISSDIERTEYTITGSYLEIYMEQIRDLLDPRRENLKVHESPSRGIWVQDLSEEYIGCEQDVWDLLAMGSQHRKTAATSMNARSSRSHCLFIITLRQVSSDGSTKNGSLNLVDLAGSEKVGKTNAAGQTLEEAKKINQSLSCLGNCINALTDRSRSHVPYRDSKLTRVLQESLGGNCKTTLMICTSPHSFNLEETLSTLKFGQRAKSVKLAAHMNVRRSAQELEKLLQTLQCDFSSLQMYCGQLELQVEWYKGPDYTPGKLCPIVASMDTQLITDGDGESESAKAEGEVKDEEEEDVVQELPSLPVKSRRRSRQQSVSMLNPMMVAELQLAMRNQQEAATLEIESLREDVARLTEVETENTAEIDRLKAALSASEDAVDDVRNELTALRTAKGGEIKKLNYELKLKSLEVEGSQDLIDEANEETAEAEAQLATANEELDRVRSELAASASELETLKGTVRELAARADVATRLEVTVGTQEETIKQLEVSLRTSRDAENAVNDAIAVVRAQLAARATLLDQKTSQAEELSRRCEELEAKLREVTAAQAAAVLDADTRIQQMTSTLGFLKQELDATSKREATLLAETEVSGQAVSHDLARLNREKEMLESRLVAEQEAHKTVQSRLDSTIATTNEQIRSLEVVVAKEQANTRALDTQLRETKAKAEALETTISSLTSKQHQLESQIRQEQDSTSRAVSALQSEKDARRADKLSFGELQNKLKTENSSLHQEVFRLQALTKTKDETIRVRDADLLCTKKNYEAKTAKTVHLLKQLEAQTMKLMEVDAQCSEQMVVLDQLQAEYGTILRSDDQLRSVLSKKENEVEELRQKLQEQPLRGRARVFKPLMGSGNVDSVFGAKIDFGQHLLRRTSANIREDAQKEAASTT